MCVLQTWHILHFRTCTIPVLYLKSYIVRAYDFCDKNKYFERFQGYQ